MKIGCSSPIENENVIGNRWSESEELVKAKTDERETEFADMKTPFQSESAYSKLREIEPYLIDSGESPV